MSEDKWPALESNPDCFNELLSLLDVKSVVAKDVFAFEKDAYHGDYPYALLLCFSNYDEARKILDKQSQDEVARGIERPKDIFVAKQDFYNSCGTFALFNALANLEGRIDLGKGAFSEWLFVAKYFETEEERGNLIQKDHGIKMYHEKAAKKAVTPPQDKVDNHFITFVYKGGVIYEIDSCGLMPKTVGKTTEENFLVDCGAVIQEFVSKVNSGAYSVLALLPSP